MKLDSMFKFINLYEGEDTGSGGGEEIIPDDSTNEDDDSGEEQEVIEEIEPVVETEEEKTEREEKETKEKEDKDTETTDEQKKDSVIKQALAKHPKIFKEFPELRSAYFENKQFKEVFTSVDEAKEAVDNANVLKAVSADLQAGKPEKVIEYLKSEPKTLTQFTRNLIKDLPKEVFSDAMAPSIIEMLKEIKETAKLHKNEDLENSVGWISKYLFNNHELPTIKEAKVEEQKENPLLTQVAKNFSEEVSEDAIGALNTLIDTSLASLKDAKPAVKKTIVSEIKEELDNTIGKDAAHNKLMAKLWADAKASNYSKASKASIKSAYLAAVNKRLPEVRATVLKNNGYKIGKSQKKADTENKTPNFTKNGNKDTSNTSSQDVKVAALKKSGATERQVLDALLK